MKNNKMHTLLDLMLSGVNLELTKEGSEIAWSEIAHRTIKPKKEEIKYTISSIGADESITVYCAEIDASIYNVLPEHIITYEVVNADFITAYSAQDDNADVIEILLPGEDIQERLKKSVLAYYAGKTVDIIYSGHNSNSGDYHTVECKDEEENILYKGDITLIPCSIS